MSPLEKLKALAVQRAKEKSGEQSIVQEQAAQNVQVVAQPVRQEPSSTTSNASPVSAEIQTEVKEVTITPVQAPVTTQSSESSDPRVVNIRTQLAELEAALKQNIPSFPTILRDIHTKLRQDPEVVTLMSDAEIKLVLQGLQKHAQIEVVAPAAAKQAKKALPPKGVKIQADML